MVARPSAKVWAERARKRLSARMRETALVRHRATPPRPAPVPRPPLDRFLRLIRRRDGHWLWGRYGRNRANFLPFNWSWRPKLLMTPRTASWRLFHEGRCTLTNPCGWELVGGVRVPVLGCVHTRGIWQKAKPARIESFCGEPDCVHPLHLGPCGLPEKMPTYPERNDLCRGCSSNLPVELYNQDEEASIIAVCICGWQLRGHRQHKRATEAALLRHKKHCADEFNAYQVLRRAVARREQIRLEYGRKRSVG